MRSTAVALEELVADLAALGVAPGQDLMVSCSLRALGPVDGGVATVLRALQEAAGPHATLVVAAQTAENSQTSRAFRTLTAGMDAAEVARFVAMLPGFDAATSPSTGMGVLAEYVRTRPGAVRSAHPLTSFAALGPQAAECTAGHELDCHLGERSPLGWLDRARGAELLLGLGYAACKSFHLAEYRLAEPRPRARYHCFVCVGGKRMPKSFTAVELDDSDFDEVGSRFDQGPFVRRGRVAGAADCRLLQLREAVAFAMTWPPFGARRAAA